MHRSRMLSVLSLALILAASACQSSSTASQNTEKAPAEKASAEKAKPDPKDMQAQMDEWMKLAAPGDAHKRLEPMVGRFRAEVTMSMDPSQPAQKSNGMMNNQWVLGGRFLKSEYAGEAAGMPFEGLGLMGYDNGKKRYVGSWCDTWGTLLMTWDNGTLDASGKSITCVSMMDDPMTGKPVKMRSVTNIESKDRYTYEMWGPGPDGKEFKGVSIVYTRASP